MKISTYSDAPTTLHEPLLHIPLLHSEWRRGCPEGGRGGARVRARFGLGNLPFRCVPTAWRFALFLLSAIFLAGCQTEDRPEGAADEATQQTELCGFKEGDGVYVSDATRRVLGVAVADVTNRPLTQTIRGTARIFGPGKASLLLEPEAARRIQTGQAATLSAGGHVITGTVAKVDHLASLAWGKAEVLVEFSLEEERLQRGFAEVLLESEPVSGLTVPASSVLETGAGKYVFVANGSYFLRTAIEIAARADGWVTVSEGLYEGDRIVTDGVRDLWCIELHATKTGAACCL